MQSVQTVVAAIIREIATISRLTVSAVTEIITASRLAVSSVAAIATGSRLVDSKAAIIVRRLVVRSVVAIVLRGSVEMVNEEASAVGTDNFSISISFQKRTVCRNRRFLLFVFLLAAPAVVITAWSTTSWGRATTVIFWTRPSVMASYIDVPLTFGEHMAICAVTSFWTDIPSGIAEVDFINAVILSSAEADTAVNTVRHSASFFFDTWRLRRYRNSKEQCEYN